ncbi:tubulin-like doman-containing protein [Cytobacillus praedii]|uniref:tubulin-like doman-containing protein n=1 Tax=Cytobacillus praedii TaxID=1742358 RepID=UPI002E1DDB06|nr:tubulin-like doman-containing protein [Cytobacillus praedii]
MKATVREHIQQLDVSLGGGIVSEKIRVDTIDNPMLVIGLGGTGIDALLRLKYQVNRRFKLPADPISKKKKEKPNNIEYLAFETNEQDRFKKYKGIGLDPVTEFVLLSNPEIGSLLQNRSTLPSYITDWLSPELLITDGISGASGVRQAGRLLLFTKINQVVQTIEKKIKVLSEGTNKRMSVFILTGISGGTGSGCFLDISYIIRGIMEKEHGSAGVDKVSILGYLFTPDVNLSNKSLNTHTSEYIKKNGFAALKELDYWMNVDERNERFKQQYGNILTVNSPMPPYNLCHLISATNLDGKLLENAYDYTMNVTAENITNFMANEDKQSGEEFAIHDYISNIGTNIKQMHKAYAANYSYNILGASSAILPVEEMTTYLAYKVFKKMEKMFPASPTQEEVETFANRMGLDIDSVHRKFNSLVPEPIPGYENSDRLNFNNVIKQQTISLDQELEQGYLSKARENYIKLKKQYPAELLENFKEQIKRIFLNPDQGPFFVSRLIFTAKGNSLLNLIKSYIEFLQEQVYRKPMEINDMAQHGAERLADAKSALFSKDKKKNAYISTKIDEYHLRADKECMEHMIDFYQDVHTMINEENNKMYSVVTEILNTLNTIFEKNGDILIRGEETQDGSGNKTYYWNVVSVPDMAEKITEIMDTKDGNDMIADFTKDLLDQSNRWVKEQDLDIISSISEFLSEKFGDLITKSMEDFLVMKYGEDESIEHIIERKIAKLLNDEAVPVFHLNNSVGNLVFPSWGFVSVPHKAPNILKGIKDFQRTSVSGARFTVKESEVKNRIFWLNTKNGVPLFVYTPLTSYEQSYERTIFEQEGVGRHLSQSEKDNWAYLPSPIPEMSWGDIYENARLKDYNRRIRELFAKAIEFGVIKDKGEYANTNNKFEVILSGQFNLSEILNQYQMEHHSDKPNLGEVKKCISELRRLLTEQLPVVSKRDIFGSSNKNLAIENFIRTPNLIHYVKEEVLKYESIQEVLYELEASLKSFQDETVNIEKFIEVLYTSTITKKGAVYVYDHDVEEESWEPFLNLTKVNKFIEFELYQVYRSLNEKRKAIIDKKADRRNTNLSMSDDTGVLTSRLEALSDAALEAKSTLEYDRKEFVNGEEMYTFYKQILEKVNSLIKVIR